MLDELGYHRVDVLGYSWGGALAQQFAVQHAGRCRRLVLISTNTGVLSVPAAPAAFAKMLTPRGFRDYAMGMTAGSMGDGEARGRSNAARALFRNTRDDISVRGYLYQLAATAGWSSLPFLPLIRQPMLVMGGKHDPIVPAGNARILASLIPNATLHLFPPAATPNHSPRPPTSGPGSPNSWAVRHQDRTTDRGGRHGAHHQHRPLTGGPGRRPSRNARPANASPASVTVVDRDRPGRVGHPVERLQGLRRPRHRGRGVAMTLAPAAGLLSTTPAGRSAFIAGSRSLPWQPTPADARQLLTAYADSPAYGATNWAATPHGQRPCSTFPPT